MNNWDGRLEVLVTAIQKNTLLPEQLFLSDTLAGPGVPFTIGGLKFPRWHSLDKESKERVKVALPSLSMALQNLDVDNNSISGLRTTLLSEDSEVHVSTFKVLCGGVRFTVKYLHDYKEELV